LRNTRALHWVKERVPALEVVDRLVLAVSSIDRFLGLAPITWEELREGRHTANRCSSDTSTGRLSTRAGSDR
jgi:hypothetical protein